MSIFGIVSLASLSILLIFSLYYNYKLGIIILNVEDSIENSLDILDERYKKISDIAVKPVFFDSLEVRQVIDEINKSRDAILFIANILTNMNESVYYSLEVDNPSLEEKNNDKKIKKNIT